MPAIFTPPVWNVIPPVLPETRGPQRRLFRHYGPWPRGRSVVFENGHYVIADSPFTDSLVEGITWFQGGRTYTVDNDIAELLYNDGFDENLGGWSPLEPVTYTIYNGSAGGYVYTDPNGADGTGVFANAGDSVTTPVGTDPTTGIEGFLAFDTSSVVGTITAVTLSLWGTNTPAAAFTVEVRAHDWGATLTTADWLSRATMATKTLVASRSTAGWNNAGYNAFTAEAAFLTAINQAGTTRLFVNSSLHRTGTFTDTYVVFRNGYEPTQAQRPKLVIEALV